MNEKSLTVTRVSKATKNLTKLKGPLFSSQPAAGFPAPGDDLVEKPLDLNTFLVKNESATFFVKVAGDSMEGARIFDGDILVVDRSLEPKSGSIVVAAVYGELVVKKLMKTDKGASLVSENANYEPILIDGQDDCFIWGVVTGCVRTLA